MDRISSFFLARCIISVASLSFLSTRLSYEKKNLSIPDLTAMAQKNSSCVLGMTISDYGMFLMSESSFWWVFFNDSTNGFCD